MSFEGWKEGSLDDIADIIMGQSPSGDKCNEVGNGFPLLNGPTEFGASYPTPVQYTTDPKKFSETNDLLFCVRGSTTGRMNWANQKYAIGRGLAAIRHKHGNELQPFLKAVIEYNLPTLLAEATGSTFPNVSSQQLKGLKVVLPSKDEQRKISKVLSSIDEKIELNRQTNQTLEAIAGAIFKEWFVDFNFPGATGEVKKEIPIGWKKTTINSVASSIQYGYTQSSSQEIIGPKFLRITDIQGGTVNWANVPYCKVPDKDLAKYQIREHDIFIARTGASTGENIYVVDPPRAVFASYLIRVQFDTPALACYVGKHLRSKEYFEYIASVLSGSAQPNANAQQLTAAEILIPERTLLEKYFGLVNPLNRPKSQLNEENQTLSQLRDNLLPKLMKGEIKF